MRYHVFKLRKPWGCQKGTLKMRALLPADVQFLLQLIGIDVMYQGK